MAIYYNGGFGRRFTLLSPVEHGKPKIFGPLKLLRISIVESYCHRPASSTSTKTRGMSLFDRTSPYAPAPG
jgi:hypothetical protein